MVWVCGYSQPLFGIQENPRSLSLSLLLSVGIIRRRVPRGCQWPKNHHPNIQKTEITIIKDQSINIRQSINQSNSLQSVQVNSQSINQPHQQLPINQPYLVLPSSSCLWPCGSHTTTVQVISQSINQPHLSSNYQSNSPLTIPRLQLLLVALWKPHHNCPSHHSIHRSTSPLAIYQSTLTISQLLQFLDSYNFSTLTISQLLQFLLRVVLW